MKHAVNGQDDQRHPRLQQARLLAEQRVAAQQGCGLDAEFVGDAIGGVAALDGVGLELVFGAAADERLGHGGGHNGDVFDDRGQGNSGGRVGGGGGSGGRLIGRAREGRRRVGLGGGVRGGAPSQGQQPGQKDQNRVAWQALSRAFVFVHWQAGMLSQRKETKKARARLLNCCSVCRGGSETRPLPKDYAISLVNVSRNS